MRLFAGKVVLSPSDLMRFQGCEHSVALDLQYLRGRKIVPASDAPDAVLTQKKGQAHEDQYLAKLREKNGAVVSIERSRNFAEVAEKTRQAMAAGGSGHFSGRVGAGKVAGLFGFPRASRGGIGVGAVRIRGLSTPAEAPARPPSRDPGYLSIPRAFGQYSRECRPKGTSGNWQRRARVVSTERVRNYSDNLAARLEAFVDSPWPTIPEPVSACGPLPLARTIAPENGTRATA